MFEITLDLRRGIRCPANDPGKRCFGATRPERGAAGAVAQLVIALIVYGASAAVTATGLIGALRDL